MCVATTQLRLASLLWPSCLGRNCQPWEFTSFEIHWKARSTCDFLIIHKRGKCEHKWIKGKHQEKKKERKTSWEMNRFSKALIPDARLAVSICSLSLSLPLSVTVLSLPVSHILSQISLGNMRIHLAASGFKNQLCNSHLGKVQDRSLWWVFAHLDIGLEKSSTGREEWEQSQEGEAT